ncbi:fimbrial biogenesis outer membrane usher protein [Citrobacter braakii]|uniref:fimbria/pilus outer membrane usher protein n=1 Tax=Citrobacter braakii TaxID=57706 RepID=UPI001906BE05|nr:fimbria/pilus outer membrane usher protein [Citrobacter braakii]MBJ8896354.1 fimbrial biogenesis outer membrane usher protein [Citrobacter braakii]
MKIHRNAAFLCGCHLSAIALLCASDSAGADKLHFDPAFLSNDPSAVAALDLFEQGATQPPGKYHVELWLNNEHTGTQDIAFELNNGTLEPCFSDAEFKMLGIKPPPGKKPVAEGSCQVITHQIDGTTVNYDTRRQVLKITVPQILIQQNARGYIDPAEWDDGITALRFNYQYSGSTGSGGMSGDDNFLNLQSGLNLGPWRLRDYSTWNNQNSSSNSSGGNFQHISTTLTRSINALRSTLMLGDTWTSGELFDSINLRGAQLESENGMYPDSLQGFAPTIHGTARSNAQVSVKQNGYVIYQTYVPPGAFVINDLYPAASSGDLEVTIKESDNSQSSFIVPYAAVPMLQREGRVNYNIAVGQYQSNDNHQDNPEVAQAQLFWGLPYNTTLYGGMQWSDKYRSQALGLGMNMGSLGAISVDVTHADSTLIDDSRHSGESYRFLYSKTLEQTNTHIQLAGYRYSTRGFYTLQDTTWNRMSGDKASWNEDDDRTVLNTWNLGQNKRSQFQFTLSQSLAEWGSVFVSADNQDYWNSSASTRNIQTGYNGTLDKLTYSVTYSYNKISGSSNDRILFINLSVPLSAFLPASDDYSSARNLAWVSYSNNTDSNGNSSNSLGLSGTLLKDSNLNYNIRQNVSNQNTSYGGNASLGYRGARAQTNLAYSYDTHGNQLSYGIQGSALVHANGITLSQELGDTNVLIKAPGAEGVALENATGIKTDSRGYTVIPWATAWRQNRIALRASDINDDVEITHNVQYVVPTKGAIVRAEFNAKVGARALITLTHNGKAIPFGATVTGEENDNTSIVGDDGQVFMSGLAEQGILKASWGKNTNQRCQANYQLSANDTPLLQLQVECQ